MTNAICLSLVAAAVIASNGMVAADVRNDSARADLECAQAKQELRTRIIAHRLHRPGDLHDFYTLYDGRPCVGHEGNPRVLLEGLHDGDGPQ